MKKFLSAFALMGSVTTIFCCFLPFLFATLGMGAVFASLVGAFPQIVWLSENKLCLFIGAGVLLVVAGYFQLRNQNEVCPTDPSLAESCSNAKQISKRLLFAAAIIYAVGFLFAYVLPAFLT